MTRFNLLLNSYIALLRGINVGGKNIIRMEALKSAFESLNLKQVQTYIQSGNVLFQTEQSDLVMLSNLIEQRLSKQFNYHGRVVLITKEQLAEIVHQSPLGFGSEPETYRYDVVFLMESLSSEEAISKLRIRSGVDMMTTGPKVIYFRRLISKASQSHLSKIVSMPMYQQMTIRNWNTTTKLLKLISVDSV